MARLTPFRLGKDANRAESRIIPPEHDHKSVLQADPYGFQASHRRMAWLLRMSVAMNVILGLGFVSAVEANKKLIENYEPKVALLRTDPADNRIYRVEPIREDVPGFELLLEQKARWYVRNILEVDRVTQGERFRQVFAMTDQKYYEKFWKDRVESKAIDEMMDAGITRSITIESANKIETSADVYKFAVDFIQTDQLKGKPKDVRKARAYLTMTTRPKEVSPEDLYENPLGITVLEMVLKEVRNK
jgi:type IV secretion system protein VirB8